MERFMSLPLTARTVSGTGRIGFPDHGMSDMSAGRQADELTGNFIVKILCHIFSRGIDGGERLEIVDELMVETLDDAAQHLFEMGEVDQQADIVELWAFERDLNTVIVTMDVFALALVAAKGVPGGKCLFYADLKHR